MHLEEIVLLFGLSVLYFCFKLSIRIMANNLFTKYVWMLSAIYHAGKISYSDLNKKYVEKFKEKLPLRTFHNHKDAIEELFSVKIKCDRKNGFRYYIAGIENIKNGELGKLIQELLQEKN